MGDTQEARDRHRQTLALESIAGYLKDLIPIVTNVNQTLKDFAKMSTPSYIVHATGERVPVEVAKDIATHPEGGV